VDLSTLQPVRHLRTLVCYSSVLTISYRLCIFIGIHLYFSENDAKVSLWKLNIPATYCPFCAVVPFHVE
jgi:hypothetical protein